MGSPFNATAMSGNTLRKQVGECDCCVSFPTGTGVHTRAARYHNCELIPIGIRDCPESRRVDVNLSRLSWAPDGVICPDRARSLSRHRTSSVKCRRSVFVLLMGIPGRARASTARPRIHTLYFRLPCATKSVIAARAMAEATCVGGEHS